MLLWAAQFSGYLPAAYLQGPVWHGHEMLFGYAIAVIAGFLLTAVRAWTNQPTASGGALMALAALWIAGRVLVLTPYAMAAAVINAAFPPRLPWRSAFRLSGAQRAQLFLRRPAAADERAGAGGPLGCKDVSSCRRISGCSSRST